MHPDHSLITLAPGAQSARPPTAPSVPMALATPVRSALPAATSPATEPACLARRAAPPARRRASAPSARQSGTWPTAPAVSEGRLRSHRIGGREGRGKGKGEGGREKGQGRGGGRREDRRRPHTITPKINAWNDAHRSGRVAFAWRLSSALQCACPPPAPPFPCLRAHAGPTCIVANCKGCPLGSPGTCAACADGFDLSNGTCQKAPQGGQQDTGVVVGWRANWSAAHHAVWYQASAPTLLAT
jgi:hypothetical protein